jgi:hypothetical protein
MKLAIEWLSTTKLVEKLSFSNTLNPEGKQNYYYI